MSAQNYRPDVDGLRAVAVIGVVLFHANLGVTGGYTGVDVFFVISGYLITKLILNELSAGRFSLSGFWERRIRRILPASALVIGCTLIVGAILLLPGDLMDLSKSSIAHSLLASNVFFWQNSGYFDGPAETKPLLHTWSLAVEEQFYLVFPLVLVFCVKLSARYWTILLGTLGMISFLLSIWGSYREPTATFYLLPTRAWELVIGALIAGAPQFTRLSPRLAEMISCLGLAGILFTFFYYGSTTRFPGASAFLPVAATALIIWSNTSQPTAVGRLLSLKPAVFIGLISYSLYLWHWPMLVLLRSSFSPHPTLQLRLLTMLLSVGLAVISWRFVEVPFRRRAPTSRKWPVFVVAILVSTSILAFSAFMLYANGLPRRFPVEFLRFIENNAVPTRYRTMDIDNVEKRNLPELGSREMRDASFLLWGDSHAMAVGELLDTLAADYELKGFAACRKGVPPILGAWKQKGDKSEVSWNQAVLDFVRSLRIKNVLLVARWEVYINGENSSTDLLIVDDQSRSVSPIQSKQALSRGLRRTVDALEREGINVWIMLQVPTQHNTPKEIISTAIWRSQPIPQTGVTLGQHLERQASVDDVLNELKTRTVHILNPAEFCFDLSGNSVTAGGGRSYYADDDHVSPYGADQLLRKMFAPVINEIAVSSNASRTEVHLPSQRPGQPFSLSRD